VSKAFTCLTDPQRRAYYDRTGHEDVASAQAAARTATPGGGGGGGFYQQEMDPADLFNMMFPGMGGMFGRGPTGMNARSFPSHHANPFQPRAAPPRQEGAGRGLSGLLPRALGALGRLSLSQKLVLGSMALQALPLLLSAVAWLLWLALVGVPLHLAAREVLAFERRALYAPLRCLPGVRGAVARMRPAATRVLAVTGPVAGVVHAAVLFIGEACRAVASV